MNVKIRVIGNQEQQEVVLVLVVVQLQLIMQEMVIEEHKIGVIQKVIVVMGMKN